MTSNTTTAGKTINNRTGFNAAVHADSSFCGGWDGVDEGRDCDSVDVFCSVINDPPEIRRTEKNPAAV